MANSTAAVAGAEPGRGAWVRPVKQQLSFGRRTLATLSEEELRRKMEEFNDMFVTASTVFEKTSTTYVLPAV